MRGWIMGCALLAGCTLVNDPGAHQGGVDAGAGAPPVEALDFCDRFGELMCAAHYECCLMEEPTPAELNDCLSMVEQACRQGSGQSDPVLNDIATDDRTGYDAQVAGDVFAEGEMLLASCDPAFLRWKDTRLGLLRVLTGTRDIGQTCTPEPFDGLRPDYGALLSCRRAEDGAYRTCVSASSEWRCVERGGEGVGCSSDFECLNAYYCTGNILGPGECRMRKADGESCSKHRECESLFCNDETVCADANREQAYCGMM